MSLVSLLHLCLVTASMDAKIPIPFAYDGYDRFPTLFFGASPQNLESQSVMTLASNHSIVGWGWQQNNSGVVGAEEQNLYNQAKAFYEFANPDNNNGHYNHTKSTFVYRSGFMSGAMWNSTAYIANDTSYRGFWVQNKNGKSCVQNWAGYNYGGSPIWNFSNQTAVNYFLKNVVQQTCTNLPYINSVFFDMTDWLSCDFNWTKLSNCTDFNASYEQKREFGFAAINVYSQATKLLNDKGIIPCISLRTLMQKYVNVSGGTQCAISEEEWIDGLSNVTWFRDQEYWPDLFQSSKSSYSFLNGIEELFYAKKKNIKLPLQIHAYQVPPNTTIPTYFIATFLITQQDYSYFGASNGWWDDNWSWHDGYNVKYGKPLTMPIQLNDTAWFRQFDKCNVSVDIKTRNADIVMLEVSFS